MKIKARKKGDSFILTVDREVFEFLHNGINDLMYEEYGYDTRKVVELGTAVLEMERLLDGNSKTETD